MISRKMELINLLMNLQLNHKINLNKRRETSSPKKLNNSKKLKMFKMKLSNILIGRNLTTNLDKQSKVIN